MMKIWERYFLRETLKSFFLFIFAFYGLYVLIDFSSHASSFHYNHIHFQWRELILYYLSEFGKRADILIPFALLVSTIRTLCQLNVHQELVALMASGVKLSTLMRPFILLGLLFTALIYLNTEFVVPKALKTIKQIDDTHKRLKNKSDELPSVQHIILEDGSTLIFQSYDSSQQLFHDVYWIRSIDSIAHIKYLSPYEDPPTGRFVDILKRNGKGDLQSVASYPERKFPEIHFNKQTLFETLSASEEQPLSQLWKKLPQNNALQSEKESQHVSNFYYKIAIPWLCLFAVIGPAPFCIRFTRMLPIFFIYALSIFGLVAVYLFMDAALLLGKRQVIAPFVAIWTPFVLFGSLLGMRFYWNIVR